MEDHQLRVAWNDELGKISNSTLLLGRLILWNQNFMVNHSMVLVGFS